MALNVPHFEEDTLADSSLILADLIEKVPTRSIGAGQFVIGDTKVRPRVTDTFTRAEKLGIYQQFYNFGAGREDQKAERHASSIRSRRSAPMRRCSIIPRTFWRSPERPPSR